MANHLAVLLNFKKAPVPVDRVKRVFAPLKDWILISSTSWIVYTELKPETVRDRLRAEFSAEDPTILVIKVDKSSWSSYAPKIVPEWLRKKYAEDRIGE